MGPKPNGTTLDRIDNDGDYCKGNCRWATRKEQCRNRRSNINITINNEQKCLMEWCKGLNIDRMAVSLRLKAGWAPEIALFAPNHAGKSHKFGEFARNKKRLNSLKY